MALRISFPPLRTTPAASPRSQRCTVLHRWSALPKRGANAREPLTFLQVSGWQTTLGDFRMGQILFVLAAIATAGLLCCYSDGISLDDTPRTSLKGKAGGAEPPRRLGAQVAWPRSQQCAALRPRSAPSLCQRLSFSPSHKCRQAPARWRRAPGGRSRGKLFGLPWGGKSAGLSQRKLPDLVLQKGGCKSMGDAASPTSAVTARIADGSCFSIWRR